MKSAEITIKGGARRVLILMAGLGTAAALVLAPAAAGISGATQPPTAPPATTTTMTTVVTNGTWTVTAYSDTTGTSLVNNTALVECPYSTYKTIPGATWIWGNFGQTRCQSSPTGPGTAPVGTVTLSTTFSISGTPTSATLTLAADNGATVYINGSPVATLGPSYTAANFETLHTYTNFAGALVSGVNTITIVGTNLTFPGYNPAGVIAKLSVTSVLTLTTKSQCKHTGWMQWTTPTFTNQGDCVSYVVSHGNDPVNG